MASPTAHLLDPFLANPQASALVTDFDGTLAPVVRDPRAAVPLAAVPALLRRLCRRFGCVGVVSGRPAAFLLDRLGGGDDLPGNLALHGLYGMERVHTDDGGSPIIEAEAEAAAWIAAIAESATVAERAAPHGVYIERKGLAVTLHVRNSPDDAAWAETWAEGRARRTGLVVHPGRMSWELRPPVRVDKGTVVDALVRGRSAALFAGDDIGDLPAFDALDRLDASGAHVVRVGVRSSEAPAELLERADIVVDGPAGVVALFESLE